MGDEKPDRLYYAVGAALSAWERLDQVQGFLFGILVNSRQGSAEAAYGMVASAVGRSSMVLTAAGEIFRKSDPLYEELKGIISDIGQLAGRRNDIAHGYVTAVSTSATENGKSTNEKSWGHYLIPTHTNTKKRLSREKIHEVLLQDIDAPPQHFRRYAYTSLQILQYMAHFETYRQRLDDLRHRINAHCRETWPPDWLREIQRQQKIQDLQSRLDELEHGQQQPRPET